MRLLLPLLLVACGDNGLTVHNNAPVVSITSPGEGASVVEGESLSFAAKVVDEQSEIAELSLSWTLDGTARLDGESSVSGDTVLLVPAGAFTPGEHVVALVAIDPQGESGTDSISFSVIENGVPTVSFLSPADGLAYLAGEPISVDVAFDDADEPDLAKLALTWSGSATDGASLPSNPDSDGHARLVLSPAVGAHSLSVTAQDSHGATASALVTFSVVEGDEDGDGHVSADHGGDDCDDTDGSVSPSADEACNDVDDDCDGLVDDDDTSVLDTTTWYADADGDGRGSDATAYTACDASGADVATGGDCNDANADIHPGADESDCADPTDYNCDGSTGYADADSDGWPACQDCDDGVATTNPAGTEACDAADADEDCDGLADDLDGSVTGQATSYADADADAFGDAASSTLACDVPSGNVLDDTDCDDADGAVNPAATETCNGLDDDCDTLVDDADTAADPTSWYADADGDGYGDASVSVSACDAPSGYVANNEDCDDTSIDVSPAGTEACNGIDDDCDGLVDDDDSPADPTTWFEDLDGDGYGGSTSAVSCDAPTGFVSLDGDCDDTDTDYHPGASESDCADPADYNCDGSTGYADNDGDGWAACEECDDTDSAVSPSATETCNGLDDDCDGTTDGPGASDALTWYADDDGDGHGDGAVTTPDCEAPTGFVATSDDCDDTDGAVSPSATESCNGLDDDCDGLVDDDDSTVSDPSTWYADADSDGYGNASATRDACDVPAGYVADNADCDDTSSDVSPADTEACNGIDDDCDGLSDDSDPSVSGQATSYDDGDGDGYGDASDATTSCSTPAGNVSNDDDCDDTSSAVSPADTEVCNGIDDDCDGLSDDSDPSVTGQATSYDDGDGDGYGDATDATTSCSTPSGNVSNDDDCDDTSSAVSPADTEACNGIDDDCDGLSDDSDPSVSGQATSYDDGDGDGYGDASDATTSCSTPTGNVSNDDDCDDTSSAVSPADTEACNGIDDDCDGLSDDSDPSVTGQATSYDDGDGDGYGDASDATTSCSTPSGNVSNDDDCDDTSSDVSPADTERCNSIDDDCDGSTDESSAVDAATWYRDADSDGYGLATSSTAACSAPSGYVSNDDDCNDGSAAISPADSEVCDAANTDEDCDGTTDDADSSASGKSTFYADSDGDGYGDAAASTAYCDAPSGVVSNDDDCDDTSASVSPADTEYCNGEDDDCDGSTDENSAADAITWYRDADSDGYGQSSSTTAACSLPSGYAATGGDCDDSNSSEYPGATEVCDGDDDDCDGSADESGATGESTWYRDADSDGYGSSSTTASACTVPSGYVSNSTDCNDGNAGVSPGDAEVCDASNTDEDCDGTADDLDTSSSGQSTWYADADSDSYGDPASYSQLCEQPSGTVSNDDDCDDTDTGISPADTEICEDLVDQDCDGADQACGYYGGFAISSADATIYGESADDEFGRGVATGFDHDGDGYDDIVVGAPGDDDYFTDAGSTYLYEGPIAAGPEDSEDSDYGRIFPLYSYQEIGNNIYDMGDIDEDGYGDFSMSRYHSSSVGTPNEIYLGPISYGSNSYSTDSAYSYGSTAGCNRCFVNGGDFSATSGSDEIFYGLSTFSSSRGLVYVANLGVSAAVASWSGEATSDLLGFAVGGGEDGDTDGDGYTDAWGGAYQHDTGGSNAGAVYVVKGPVTGTGVPISSVYDGKINGAAAGDYLGYGMKTVGDNNDDGYGGDILVAATGDDDGGSASGVIFLFENGEDESSTADAEATIIGAEASDAIGSQLIEVGDVNGDGGIDLLVGSSVADVNGTNSGAAWLIYGPLAGSYDLSADYDAVFYGSASDACGRQGGLGDTNGDGLDDIVLGCAAGDSGTSVDHGTVSIFYGY